MLTETTEETSVTKVIGNQFVDIQNYIEFDLSDTKIPDKVYYPVLMEIIEENEGQGDAALKETLISRKNDLSPKHILIADIIGAGLWVPRDSF